MSLTGSSAIEAARAAASASRTLATLPHSYRRAALGALHEALKENKDVILGGNACDIATATAAAANGELKQSVLKRLDLSRPGKFEDMLQGVLDVQDLEDPSMLSDICYWVWSDVEQLEMSH